MDVYSIFRGLPRKTAASQLAQFCAQGIRKRMESLSITASIASLSSFLEYKLPSAYEIGFALRARAKKLCHTIPC